MPNSPHALNPDRIKKLRALATGQKVFVQRILLHWFRDHGYITLGAPPAPTDSLKLRRVRREIAITDKGREALAMDAATRAAS